MSFFRVTWNQQHDFATLHNWGCNFRCPYCSYKLRSGADGRPGFAAPKPERFLTVPEMKEALLSVKPGKVYVMGGEPSTAAELEEMLEFAKTKLGTTTRLGHTNGSRLAIPFLDGANVGFKAWSGDLHLKITGKPKNLVYDGFRTAAKAGLQLAANMVFIPELIGLFELEGLARFLAEIDEAIPLHIMGYIPVPGQVWRRPNTEEMQEAMQLCRRYLANVASSHLSSEEALNLQNRDDRFKVKIIAGA
jgi:pyruvate formate lyase activating enzyme